MGYKPMRMILGTLLSGRRLYGDPSRRPRDAPKRTNASASIETMTSTEHDPHKRQPDDSVTIIFTDAHAVVVHRRSAPSRFGESPVRERLNDGVHYLPQLASVLKQSHHASGCRSRSAALPLVEHGFRLLISSRHVYTGVGNWKNAAVSQARETCGLRIGADRRYRSADSSPGTAPRCLLAGGGSRRGISSGA